jgi:hypothetical protein
MADWFQPFGIIIATMAAVIASQANKWIFTTKWFNAFEFLAKS